MNISLLEASLSISSAVYSAVFFSPLKEGIQFFRAPLMDYGCIGIAVMATKLRLDSSATRYRDA
ncbi:MAG: hypothetical protein LBU32_02650 [Clostridiales bacterium]|nr:hypothetical protein [Clostridiales bacterium]